MGIDVVWEVEVGMVGVVHVVLVDLVADPACVRICEGGEGAATHLVRHCRVGHGGGGSRRRRWQRNEARWGGGGGGGGGKGTTDGLRLNRGS